MQKKDNQTVIIIVHFGDRSFTIECVKSLEKEERPTIVVDNASDEKLRKLLSPYSWVTYTDPGKNLFYGGGMNWGMEKAASLYSPDYFFLLNNDTVVAPGTVQAMEKKMEEVRDAGIIGPPIYYEDGKTLWITGGTVDLRKGFPKYTATTKPGVRDFICGAAMMVREKAIKNVGGFDLDFGMYAEDVDLSLRFRSKGWESYFFHAGKVVHVGSASSGSQYGKLQSYYRWRNRLMIVFKNGNFLEKLSTLIWMGPVILRDTFLYLRSNKKKELSYCWAGLLGKKMP